MLMLTSQSQVTIPLTDLKSAVLKNGSIKLILNMDPETGKWSEVTWNLVFTVVIIGFGSGFQHGYNTGVLNEIQNVTTTWIRNCEEASSSIWKTRDVCDYTWLETTFIWAQIVSTFCLGGMVGGLAVGIMSNNCGKSQVLDTLSEKKLLLAISLVTCICEKV